ncbi:uncharacterized protein FTOL_12943 [Fusarium torulosum]|uniref:Uncharacterized protein n=1 Tax=Fusarium torulosum TaxID=33205 RepID=A0AAE8MN12_9HYPO|nr:uncharacterized protein FTOL_12943 [Fusarium torulosum]
MDYYDLGLSA